MAWLFELRDHRILSWRPFEDREALDAGALRARPQTSRGLAEACERASCASVARPQSRQLATLGRPRRLAAYSSSTASSRPGDVTRRPGAPDGEAAMEVSRPRPGDARHRPRLRLRRHHRSSWRAWSARRARPRRRSEPFIEAARKEAERRAPSVELDVRRDC